MRIVATFKSPDNVRGARVRHVTDKYETCFVVSFSLTGFKRVKRCRRWVSSTMMPLLNFVTDDLREAKAVAECFATEQHACLTGRKTTARTYSRR